MKISYFLYNYISVLKILSEWVHCEIYHLFICTWFFTFSSLKYRVWWTGFLQATYSGSKNSVQTRKKNPVHQTRNFKLENVKNQLQIDKGNSLHINQTHYKCPVLHDSMFPRSNPPLIRVFAVVPYIAGKSGAKIE